MSVNSSSAKIVELQQCMRSRWATSNFRIGVESQFLAQQIRELAAKDTTSNKKKFGGWGGGAGAGV